MTLLSTFARLVCGSGEHTTYRICRADWAIEYFQHRNVEDLYLNDVSWYAEQNPEHFAFHIGEQVRAHLPSSSPGSPTFFLGLLGLLSISPRGGLRSDSIADPLGQVLEIDTANKIVHTSKDNSVRYDILVMATGSVADLPPYISPERAKDVKGGSFIHTMPYSSHATSRRDVRRGTDAVRCVRVS
jgi:nitrite reductase (NAD(P)H)